MAYVSHTQVQRARQTNLGEFLVQKYPDEFQYRGENVVNKTDPHFSVGKNICGYNNFLTGEHGNPIDFLVRHKGFGFQDAVLELNKFQDEAPDPTGVPYRRKFTLPVPLKDDDTTRASAFLLSKYIPMDTIDTLKKEGLLYEDYFHNVVFVNAEKDYYECFGTQGVAYYRANSVSPDRYWQYPFPSYMKAEEVFICHNALDTVCLCQMLDDKLNLNSLLFVSAGGPDPQEVIDIFRKKRVSITLCFGNDPFSKLYYRRNKDLPKMMPKSVSWTNDFIELMEARKRRKQ